MALVPHTQEVQREVESLQQLRRALHEAYLVEAKAGLRVGKDASKPPSVTDARRTVDAPTLSVLKSPNYPFTLCEEAPPSYVPPPVPYDVEGKIESLKKRVLQVQEDFQNYQKRHSRDGAPLPASQVIDFFSSNTTYAEVAWEVSSLQWFYRWVLSHSISHLWNCKEQLEYVLTDDSNDLPQMVEEMDACLRAYPFSAAVSILDSDRQAVVAQERRRLRSVSRIYRENVPATAVTAATSSYLSPEEKCMYQEFFNQSEHMVLLLNHTLMLNKANSAYTAGLKPGVDTMGQGLLLKSQSSVRGYSQDSGTLLLPNESAIGVMDVDNLAKETLNAVSAEQEVIATLMKVISERQERGECFEMSAAEQERTRAAQIAVYSCVLSDMSLMACQMNLTVEFMEHYEAWLKLRGYDSHEQLMTELSKHSGGTPWPTLTAYELNSTDGGHSHFVPPPEDIIRFYHPSEKMPSESADVKSITSLREDYKRLGRNVTSTAGASTNSAASFPSAPPSAAPPKAAAAGDDHMVVSPASVRAAMLHEADSDVANAFYALLVHTDKALRRNGAAAATKGDSVERTWLIAGVRYAVIKMLRRDWRAAEIARDMLAVEEALLAVLNGKRNFSRMTPAAAALCAMVQELVRLTVARSTLRSLITEVSITVHMPEDADNYAKAVADVTNPLGHERWGSLVDALWFQVDPSTASSGGLIFQPTTADGAAVGPVPCNKQGALHFLYMETIDMPPHAMTSGAVTIAMCYRLPRMSPGAEASRRVAPTLAAVAEAQPSGRGGLSRYYLAHRTLAALSEVETNGLLPCFACRVSEVGAVPLAEMIHVAFDDGNTSSLVDTNHVPHLCMLPPAAMALKRMEARVGVAPVPTSSTDEMYVAYMEPVSFHSIGLLVGGLLEDMAARAPILGDLYMAAATVREQALSDMKSGAVPKGFANTSAHPTSMECAPSKARVMSIQRESVANRNSKVASRLISPLLRHIEDKISSLQLGEGRGHPVGGSNTTGTTTQASVLLPRGTSAREPSSVTSRPTQMVNCGDTTSPSPSAVRPNRL
ncbi:hypothetical protein LSCM1_02753 [Leishmania martiniquensis]|uniref:Uncharacterized protein n=1 Tax=Leishmania martiniquensis TaxID=1580590 RepID=A0A836GPR3_9TRYP|nr:hypothetical protein LSCM1_02753 [Leishmania martiniquensis]